MIIKRKFNEWFVIFSERIVRSIGILIFGGLSIAALFSSQYMLPGGEELPINKMDFPVFQIVALVAMFGIVPGIRRIGERLDVRTRNRLEYIFLAASVLFMLTCGMLWIGSLDRVPEGDQAYIYAGASYFIEGDYSFFEKGGYCQLYPQQIDLIAFTELLFRIVGTYQYFAFEVVNVFMAAGIVLIGYLLLKEMGGNFETLILYCIAIAGCSPLICYTSWVYGDIPGVFFVLLSTLFLLRMQRTNKTSNALISIIVGILAVLVRRNNLIFFVALFLLSIVCIVGRQNRKTLLIVVAMYLGFCLCNGAIKEMYETRSGNEIGQGLPMNSWIAMGMQEHRGVCGWYNNMPKEVYRELDFDFTETEQVMNGIINERLNTFSSNPAYAIKFYGKKVLSQWNDPTYQSVYFSAKYNGDALPKEGSVLEALYHTEEGYLLYFELANIAQFVVYFGMLLFFCCMKFEKGQLLKWLLAVTIIGGFFFSILWEAKARYIFPYYILMFPLMIQGYSLFIAKIHKTKLSTESHVAS